MLRTLPLHALLALAGVLGCSAPQQPTGPTADVICAADYESLFSQMLTRLRGVEWRMKQVDRERGIIETLPATSAHFPEFWRVDSPGAYNYLESSLHTIRRAVSVRIERVGSPADGAPDADPMAAVVDCASADSGAGRYRIEVEVRKERFSTPERQVTTASGTLGLFSEKTPTIYGYFRARPGDARWISLGRDEALERSLLNHLLRGHEREALAATEPNGG